MTLKPPSGANSPLVEDDAAVVRGLRGDGSDDRAALQAAVSSGASEIVIPAGTFSVDSSTPITVPATVSRIRGRGVGQTVIKVKSGTTPGQGIFQIVNRSGIEISDLEFDLNKANTTDPGADTSGQAIYFVASSTTGNTRCAVRRCYIHDGHRLGIYIGNSDASTNPSQVTVEDCVIKDCTRMGIYVTRPTDVRIVKNTLTGCGVANGGQIQASLTGKNLLIEGNTVTDSNTSSNGIVIAFQSAARIIGNYCARNDAAGASGWGIVVSEDCRYFTVAGNHCDANGSGGISVDVKTAASEALKESDGAVSGNVCSNAVTNHGIFLNYCRRVAVTGNSCNGNANSGIMAVTQRCTFTGNVCTGNGKGLVFNDSATATAMGNHDVWANQLYTNTTSDFSNTATTPSRGVGQGAQVDGKQVGVYAPSDIHAGFAALTLVAAQAQFVRFVPKRDMTVTMLAFNVSTAAGANDNVDVGIYNSALTRLASSGLVAGQVNATGVKTVNLSASVVLRAGTVYYAALLVPAFGGTAPAVGGVSLGATNNVGLFGLTAGLVELLHVAAAGASLGASYGAFTVTSVGPWLAVRES